MASEGLLSAEEARQRSDELFERIKALNEAGKYDTDERREVSKQWAYWSDYATQREAASKLNDTRAAREGGAAIGGEQMDRQEWVRAMVQKYGMNWLDRGAPHHIHVGGEIAYNEDDAEFLSQETGEEGEGCYAGPCLADFDPDELVEGTKQAEDVAMLRGGGDNMGGMGSVSDGGDPMGGGDNMGGMGSVSDDAPAAPMDSMVGGDEPVGSESPMDDLAGDDAALDKELGGKLEAIGEKLGSGEMSYDNFTSNEEYWDAQQTDAPAAPMDSMVGGDEPVGSESPMDDLAGDDAGGQSVGEFLDEREADYVAKHGEDALQQQYSPTATPAAPMDYSGLTQSAAAASAPRRRAGGGRRNPNAGMRQGGAGTPNVRIVRR